MSEEYLRFGQELQKALKELKLPIILNKEQIQSFYQFYTDLAETNKVMNLTSITEEKEVILKHFADSIALILAVPDLDRTSYRILDMGTGAGFPGIPLAIAFPDLKLTLADSLNKRILFIQREAEILGLKNVTAVHGRAEDLARKAEYREHFDICVSRAVANLSTLSEYCIPFIHTKGFFIPYKSGNIEEETRNAAKALSVLKSKIEMICSYSLPEDAGDRTLIIIKKTEETPKKYPRKAGLPSKEPIG